MTEQLDRTNPTVADTIDSDHQMVGKAHAVSQPRVDESADAVPEPTVGVAEPARVPMKLLD